MANNSSSSGSSRMTNASASTDGKKPFRPFRRKETNGSTAASAKQPGRLAQMRTVFDMTRRNDPQLVPLMAAAFVGTVVLLLIIGLLVHNWVTFLILGIFLGILAAMLILSLRAQNAALSQIEDQPGASASAMSLLRRGWVLPQEPSSVNPKTRDLVFRAVGRPGVVLVTEGPEQRVKQLIVQEKNKLRKVLPDVPVHAIQTGRGEGQVRLQDLPKTMRKLPKQITDVEVQAVDQRLRTLSRNTLPIPKGIDPNRARASRKGMR